MFDLSHLFLVASHTSTFQTPVRLLAIDYVCQQVEGTALDQRARTLVISPLLPQENKLIWRLGHSCLGPICRAAIGVQRV